MWGLSGQLCWEENWDYLQRKTASQHPVDHLVTPHAFDFCSVLNLSGKSGAILSTLGKKK